ncbi:MAG: hypothetical protein ACPG7F_02070 [Aggregatilineales bacterium]
MITLQSIHEFDLAFGRAPAVFMFAAQFEKMDVRPALTWMQWPDWLITDEGGSMIPIMNPASFRAFFDLMMTQYFAAIPDGRFKFNLTGLESEQTKKLTIWELKKLSTDYLDKTDFYHFDDTLKVLDSSVAKQEIAHILEA